LPGIAITRWKGTDDTDPKGDFVVQDIVFKHHFRTTNLGDRVCNPFDHYPDLASRGTRIDLDDPTPACKVVVYGGGKIMGGLRKSLTANDRAARARIAWGVSTVQKNRFSLKYWLAYRQMNLVGTRDFGDDRFPWSPCVTCLAAAFDQSYPEEHDVVAYVHHWRVRDRGVELPVGIPVMENIENDLPRVLRFIASGRTVMSNSYHGVYWALLLGKKVLCVPYSNKFYNYRLQPGYSTGRDWYKELSKARGYDEMMGLCRDGAARFEAQARALIG
jgi:hypothetical protein